MTLLSRVARLNQDRALIAMKNGLKPAILAKEARGKDL